MRVAIQASVAALAMANGVGAADSIVASAQWADFTGAVQGGPAGSVDWLHGNPGRTLLGVGMSYQDFADTQLVFGRVSGLRKIAHGVTLTAVAEVGASTAAGTHEQFQRQTFETLWSLPAAWQLNTGLQYFEANNLHALVTRAGVNWSAWTPLQLSVQGGASVNGTLPTRFGMLRADYVGRAQWYVGLVRGRGAHSVVELGDVGYQHYTEEFIGVTAPVSRYLVGFTWDRLDMDALTRQTLTITLRAPITTGD